MIRWFVLAALAALGLGFSARLLWPETPAHAKSVATPTQVSRSSTVTERGAAIEVSTAPRAPGVSVGENHEWYVTVHRTDGGDSADCRVRFDGTMPEHGHGLPTSPRVHEKPEGERFLVEGVRFSMPGFWQLRAIAECEDSKQIAKFDLRI